MDDARADRAPQAQPPTEAVRPAPEAVPGLDALAAVLADVCRPAAEDGRFALAFSGGLDSRFLAHAACLLGHRPLLLHVTGPHVPPEETAYARRWAEKRALPFIEVPADPLALPLVAAGDRRRCYACKHELFRRLLKTLESPAVLATLPEAALASAPPHAQSALRITAPSSAQSAPESSAPKSPAPDSPSMEALPASPSALSPAQSPASPSPLSSTSASSSSHAPGDLPAPPIPHVARLALCDGTNASDLTTYRPGLQALRELGIRSPLAEAGLSKADIRRIAAATGMEEPDQKARPCLLTRLPYGVQPLRGTLEALGRAEQALRLALAGTSRPDADFRLRLTAPDRTELHLLRADAAGLAPQEAEALLLTAAQAAPSLPPPALVPQDSLSGYFDRL